VTASTVIAAPWLALKDVCHLYGVKYTTAMNKVRDGTFDVPVYKVGKLWVVDREVHEAYFARMRQAGLAALKSTKSGQAYQDL
jgi:predicted site-specific integrase-resolvase